MTAIANAARASILVLAMLASGCGDNTASTAPSASPAPATSPVPSSGAPVPGRLSLRLSGHVRDWDHAPIGQALIKVRGSDEPVTAVTDGTGFYDTTVPLDLRYTPLVAWISIRRDGYEDLENAAVFANRADATADYLMFPKTTVTAGSIALLQFALNGPLCGFDEEYACRHMTIAAPASGTLVMETFGNAESSFFFGPIEYPFVGLTKRTVPVNAGDSVPIELVWGRSTMRQTSSTVTEGTLVTRIDP